MLIALNQLKTSLLAFKDWVLARIPSKTSDLTNDSGFITANDETVKDVQVNGTSILDGGVANIPLTSDTNYGLVKYGAGLRLDGSFLTIFKASNNQTKAGAASYSPIVPSNQHLSAFYGLAKAAGHDEKDSANPVGTYTEEAKTAIRSMLDVPSVDDIPEAPVQDVQVNNASLLDSNGVANIPNAGIGQLGVAQTNPNFGTISGADGIIRTCLADATTIKTATNTYNPIVPSNQHTATFYGLAKAAGDTTQSASSNAVGTYTDEAKSAIRSMLDVPETNSKAPVIVETASGAIASFDDGADDVPVKGLSVAVEPIQDLHGYDYPWPAGGGVNKFFKNNDVSNTLNGVTCSFDAETQTFTINGTNESASAYILLNLIPTAEIPRGVPLSRAFIGAPTGVYVNLAYNNNGWQSVSNGDSIPDSIELSNIRVQVGVLGTAETVSGVFKCQIQEGSTAPTSWFPYSNICPISGWTGAKVTRTGKNLVPVPYQSAGGTISGITFTPHEDGSITIDGTATENAIYYIRAAKTALSLKAGTYTLKGIPNGSSNTLSLRVYTADGTIGYARATDYTFTLEQSEIVSLSLYVYKGYTVNNEVIKPMLVYGSTATDYEPYQSETYDITFPTEAGTVYGGNLDVTTGVLTVDRAKRTYNGSESWGDYANYEGYYILNSAMRSGARQDGCSNLLKNQKNSAVGQKNTMWLGVNSKNIYVIGVYETMGDTLEAFKSYLSTHNLEIVYPLATPITYTLTPQEIRTLLGQNNIWTDTGDTSVTYHADTKLYIDTQATAATFYGLAKAAGDTTQSESSNPVGTYTGEAKSAIKNMFGISEVQTVTVSGTAPVITAEDNHRYVCGEVTSLSFTPCASGICDVVFTSGSTVAVLTLPNTVKMPDGFEVEANATYEINILDGVWGVYQVWVN